jgi:L-ascorbate metabolism protein UlaG (beta-lactamase superfamily)
MNPIAVKITYVGGPTSLLEFGGLRFLTDPTFDPPGGDYTTGPVTLHKLIGPGLTPEQLGPFDYVLLSHDHHFDNLDHAGRAVLAGAKSVITTAEGAGRLGGKTLGLTDWESIDLPAPNGRVVRVVATPARHGPAGLHRGAVNGFVLSLSETQDQAIYISGDTVWYEGVAEIAKRFPVCLVVLHLGAAKVAEVGPFHLTMTAAEGVEAAKAFSNAAIVPIHFEDWKHFSEGRQDIARAFKEAGLTKRLQ